MARAKPSYGRFNPAHPLARGLLAAYIFDHGSRQGLGNDLRDVTRLSIAGPPVRIATPWGHGAQFTTAASSGLVALTPTQLDISKIAIAIRFRVDIDPAGATFDLVAAGTTGVGTFTKIGINYAGLTNGSVAWYQTDSFPHSQLAYTSAELPGDPANLGKWYDFVGWNNGPGKTFGYHFRHADTGAFIENNSQPVVLNDALMTHNNNFTIGCASNLSGNFSNVSIAHVIVWNTTDFSYEMAALACADPYGVASFSRPNILTSTGGGGGGGGTHSPNFLTLGVG